MSRILFFTVHKAASMFLFEVARDLCAIGDITLHSPHGGVRFEHEDMLDPANWGGRSGCVAPIRQFVPLPGLEHDRVLVHLRDPRDVLTSLYYSMAYSHRLEGTLTEAVRTAWQQRGIDTAIMQEHEGEPVFASFARRYRDYLEHLIGRPNVTLLRYEDMLADFPTWLRRVVTAFGVEPREPTVAGLLARHQHAFHVAGEDVMQHKRQVTPGDHRRRLRPETIAFLDEEFADILQALGYAGTPEIAALPDSE